MVVYKRLPLFASELKKKNYANSFIPFNFFFISFFLHISFLHNHTHMYIYIYVYVLMNIITVFKKHPII